MARAWYYLKFILRKALELIKIPFFMLFDSLAYLEPVPNTKKGNLILRCDAIGDYFLFRNFITSYEKAFGRDTVFLIRPSLSSLYQDLDHISKDRLITFKPNKFEINLRYRLKILRSIRKRGFHRIIQPNYSKYFFVEDCLVRLSGADQRIGIIGSTNNIGLIPKMIASGYYNNCYQSGEDITFEFFRNKEIASLICKQDITPVFGIKMESHGRSDIVIAPGAGTAYRRWAPENFSQLIHLLSQKYEADFIIIGSQQDELTAEKIISELNQDISVKSLCGQMSLTETVQLIANASILITNESGPAHIGAATGTKTICISNGNHFGRFHPYPASMNTWNHYIYPEELEIQVRLGNQKMMENRLKFRSFLNINRISPEKVMERILKVS